MWRCPGSEILNYVRAAVDRTGEILTTSRGVYRVIMTHYRSHHVVVITYYYRHRFVTDTESSECTIVVRRVFLYFFFNLVTAIT